MEPHLKYAGEALFLLGVSFRLLQWVVGALREGDAPPSASVDLGPLEVGAAGHADRAAPPALGDPALFPPEMLAAMTPEQRAQVLETLTKQRGGGRSAA